LTCVVGSLDLLGGERALASGVAGEGGGPSQYGADAGTSRSPAPRAARPSCWPATPATRRLGDAIHQWWAFCALTSSPGARTYYDTLRHNAALRQLGDRLVGILHGCPKTRSHYDETTAWTHHQTAAAARHRRPWDV
jgi:hypothetical protein